MSEGPRHSVSVSGVVIDGQGRVLIVQRRATGAWTLPGGVLELDETPLDGLLREIEEETGLRVSAQHLSGVYKNMSTHVVSLVFRCRPVGDRAPLTSEETSAVRWLPPAEAYELMTDAFSARVRAALSDSAPVVEAFSADN